MSDLGKASGGTVPSMVALVMGGVVTIVGTVILAQSSDTLREEWYVLAAAGIVAALLATLLVAATGRRTAHVVSASPGAAATEPVPFVAPTAAGSEVLVPLSTLASSSLPKEGASAEENDDAGAAGPLGVAAVADGASSSFDAGAWARTLVRRWLEAPPAVTPTAVAAWALECAASYATERATRAGADGSGSSWWQAEAGQKAAHATFLGLRVVRTSDGLVWRAVAVGDALVLHLRRAATGFQVVSGFPYEASSAASGAPLLLASDAAETRSLPSLRTVEGPAEPEDVWLLATDEVARWALAADEAGEPIWEVLATGGKAFERAVSDARVARSVVNDDMTCVVVRASA
ncbi:hypothetical protein ACFQ0K_13495 [Nocardioides caeni]|uniref:hypothetical protein n=1 Tax=Nocardioides caeni TaxID=574700 RepID=UPI0013051364|nr:hypothetical protein [Nocardioides caeni]